MYFSEPKENISTPPLTLFHRIDSQSEACRDHILSMVYGFAEVPSLSSADGPQLEIVVEESMKLCFFAVHLSPFLAKGSLPFNINASKSGNYAPHNLPSILADFEDVYPVRSRPIVLVRWLSQIHIHLDRVWPIVTPHALTPPSMGLRFCVIG